MTHETAETSFEAIVELDKKRLVRVLFVDDEIGLLEIAKQCLEAEDTFQVDTASSVREAYEEMKKELPDAIVSDYQMPEKDGLQFLRELRQSGNKIPFIIFTGRGREEVAITALNLGASQYLNKTGDPGTVYCGLAHAIRHAVNTYKAEEKTKQSEEKFMSEREKAEEYLRIVGSMVVALDSRGDITLLNKKGHEILGYVEGGLLGKNWFDTCLPEENREETKKVFEKCMQGQLEQAAHHENTVVTRDGERRIIGWNNTILKDNDGRIIGTLSSGEDITERKRAEATLEESEAKYQSLVEQSLQGIVIAVGPEPRGVFANKAMTEIFGYAVEDFYSFAPKQIGKMIHPEDREQFFRNFKNRLQGKEVPSHYEFRGVRKDGSIIWLEISSKAITYEGQRAVQAIFSDITERKRAGQKLQRFFAAVKASLDGIVTGDLNGNIEDVNEAALKMYGSAEKSDLIGGNVQNLLVERDRPRALQNAMEIIRTGQGKTVEYTALTGRGVEVPIDVTTELLRNERGEPIGFVDIIRDLTELKNQQRLVEESQKKFRALFHGNPEASAFVDTDMHILDVNARFTGLFGYALEEIKGRHINDVVVPENLLEEGRMLDRKAGDGYVYHDTLRRMKNGCLVPVSVSAAPIYVKSTLTGYVWLYKDISQQRTAEESLKESEERFRALFAGSPEAAVYLGSDFHIRDVNPRFEQLFGYSLAEIRGKHIDDVVVQKGRIEEATALNQNAVIGYVYHDTVRRRKNESLVPVSISAAPIVIKDRLIGIVGMYKDITDLKNAEEKTAMMNEKLRVVGGLTRHDVRNKLSIITGNTYLMKKKLKDRPDVMEGFEEFEAACANIVQLLDFAKDYERLGVDDLDYVDVEDCVQKTTSLFHDRDGTKVLNECQGLSILADSLLSKLFYNLIDNSLKHGGRVSRIRISHEKSEDQLSLIYEDDGVGISPEAKPRLFTEGFTTGKGSGYGLFMIKKLMEVYGWTIQEMGTPETGTRFVMTVPKLNKQGKTNYRISSGS